MSRCKGQNALIAAAAKAALAPLGCEGRSRHWILDQCFWLVNIEFQPSSWAKGTYLNIGATWLWHARKGLAFHHGYRIGDFIAFENEESFLPQIEQMAERARLQVIAMREQFSSLSRIYECLKADLTDEIGPIYRTAVVAGLMRDVTAAQRLFDKVTLSSVQAPWQEDLQSEAKILSSILNNTEAYRAAVAAIVQKCRALNELSDDPGCIESSIGAISERK